MKMTAKNKETTQDNIPMTVRNMEMQDPKQSRPPKPTKKVHYNSDCSDLEDEKEGQARAKPLDI